MGRAQRNPSSQVIARVFFHHQIAGAPTRRPSGCRDLRRSARIRRTRPRLRHCQPYRHHSADTSDRKSNERRLRPQIGGDHPRQNVAHCRRHPDRQSQYPQPQIEPPAAPGDIGRNQRRDNPEHRTAQTVQCLNRNDPQSDRSPPPAAPPAPATRRTPRAARLAAPIARPPAPPAAKAAPPATAAPGCRRR